jgi:hypothetical protein
LRQTEFEEAAELREGCLKDMAEELEMRLRELKDVKDALEDEVLVKKMRRSWTR